PQLLQRVQIGMPSVLAVGHLEKRAARVEVYAEVARQFDLPDQERRGCEGGGAEPQFDPIDVIGSHLQQIPKSGYPQPLIQYHGHPLCAGLALAVSSGVRQFRCPGDPLVPFHGFPLAFLFLTAEKNGAIRTASMRPPPVSCYAEASGGCPEGIRWVAVPFCGGERDSVL